MHGVFKCGIDSTDWIIKETLKGNHQLQHDPPARRVWPNIIKIINFWRSLPKRKHPPSKSFENLKIVVEDVLTPVKLSFFSYFVSLFEPFLG